MATPADSDPTAAAPADSDPAAAAPADSDPTAAAPADTRCCPDCQREVPRSNYFVHSLVCPQKRQECKVCGILVPKDRMDTHVSKNHTKKVEGRRRRRKEKRLRKQQNKQLQLKEVEVEKDDEDTDGGDEDLQPEHTLEHNLQGDSQGLLKKEKDNDDEMVAPLQPEETSEPVSQGDVQVPGLHAPSPGEERGDEVKKQNEKGGNEEEEVIERTHSFSSSIDEQDSKFAILRMVTPSGAPYATMGGGAEVGTETIQPTPSVGPSSTSAPLSLVAAEEVPQFTDTSAGEVTAFMVATSVCANSDAPQDSPVHGVDQPSLVPTAFEVASKASITFETSSSQLATAATRTRSSLDASFQNQTIASVFANLPADHPLETRTILFMDQQRRIVLQNKNGPCSLIAISNYLILKGQICLPSIPTIHQLLENVYHLILPKLKEDNEVPVIKALMESAAGLSLDVFYKRENGFKAYDTQYWIFNALGIPLFHGWVLDPESQEDSLILDAIADRSYCELDFHLSLYMSTKSAEPDLPSQSALPSDLEWAKLEVSEEEDKKCELIKRFLHKTVKEMTEYGLSQLRQNSPGMFVLFYNSHFSIVCKKNGCLYNLHSNEAMGTCEEIWFRIDNAKFDGEYVRNPFLACPKQHYSSSGLEIPEYQHQRTGKQQLHREIQHRKEGILKQPDERQIYHVRSEWKGSRQRPSIVSRGNNSLKQSLSNTTRAPSNEDVKALFSSFFLEKENAEQETRFLNFLQGYKVNDKQYYKSIVKTMKDLEIREMRVHYDHILSFDSHLARILCNCFLRLKNSLNNAARTFITELNKDLDFLCENPIVFISDLPEPDGWMTLEDLFALTNQPSEKTNVYCGQRYLELAETTPIGRRIALTNLFALFEESFCNGKSWNGLWRLSDVLVNHKLKVIINVAYCDNTTMDTIRSDVNRCRTDVLPKYKVDDQLPVLFEHLDLTLKSFSIRTISWTLPSFCMFIKCHPALKSSLTNLAFIDGIYSVLQSLSPNARRLLQCIINYGIPMDDWRDIFFAENPSSVPPMLASVWSFQKMKMSGAGDGDGEKRESESLPGQQSQVEEEICASEDESSEEELPPPFDGDQEGGMIVMRHSKYHGIQATKDEWGYQHLAKQSDVHLHNSHFMSNVLPETVKRIICNLDDFHDEFGEETYAEMLRWLTEQFEFYNRPEFPQFHNLPEFPEFPKRS